MTIAFADEMNAIKLPDGKYIGTWEGHIVRVFHNGSVLRFNIETGKRMQASPCAIVIENDQIEVTTFN